MSSEETCNQTRKTFMSKYADNIDKSVYHVLDLERIQKNNDWIKAFLKHSFDSPDKAADMIHDVLKWRQTFDANSLLTPGRYPFPEDFFKLGALWMHNKDVNSIPLMYFVVKLHKKGQYPADDVRRFVAFHLERIYKFTVTDPIVLIFDMADAGYSNLDMDMIQFVVNCLKSYYPGLIEYLVIYQMPFIFNAAWKIIKTWLPAETVKLVKFVDKKSIREFISEDQLLVHMGGTDKYKYVYEPNMYAVAEKVKEPSPVVSSSSLAVKSVSFESRSDLKSAIEDPEPSSKTNETNVNPL